MFSPIKGNYNRADKPCHLGLDPFFLNQPWKSLSISGQIQIVGKIDRTIKSHILARRFAKICFLLGKKCSNCSTFLAKLFSSRVSKNNRKEQIISIYFSIIWRNNIVTNFVHSGLKNIQFCIYILSKVFKVYSTEKQ